MIQRIQTLYLIGAALLMLICACLPIGTFTAINLGENAQMFNLCIIYGEGTTISYTSFGLAALLAAGFVTSVLNIFGYNNRKAQSWKCLIAVIFMLLWIALYVTLAHITSGEKYNFDFNYAALLPLASIFLLLMARRGIIHDEKLIKSIDRIR